MTDTLLWIGCTSSFRTIEVAKAAYAALKKLNVPFTYLGSEEGCCGSIFLRTGMSEVVEQLAARNMAQFKELRVQRLVTPCAGCYRTFSLDYPQLIEDLPMEVLHISQLFEELLPKADLSPLPLKVAYHDPCHLARHCGVYDAPRNALAEIPGLQLVELPLNREKALCCGAGGGVRAAYPEVALELARQILEEAARAGAEALASSCPFCLLNLREASRSLNGIKIYDITELVYASLAGGISHVMVR